MKQAVFDRTDDDGNLILEAEGESLRLRVTEALKKAVEAARVEEGARGEEPEQETGMPPFEQHTLPLPQIQALVRAGHGYKEIAERYHLSEKMVRRFGEPVEQERRSAISQFLSVRLGADVDTRRMGEIIAEALTASGVDPGTLEWEASRVPRQPWRIAASFERHGRVYHATWMWNMQDNTVSCVDSFSRKLTGQQDADDAMLFGDEQQARGRGSLPSWLGGEEADSLSQAAAAPSGQTDRENEPKPGTDAFADPRLARLAGVPNGEEADSRDAGAVSGQSSDSQEAGAGGKMPDSAPTSQDSGTGRNDGTDAAVPGSAAQPVSDDTGRQPVISDSRIASVPPSAHPSTIGQAEQSAEFPVVEGGTASGSGAATDTDRNPQQDRHSDEKPSRKRGHSTIPSWDDIIFGD